MIYIFPDLRIEIKKNIFVAILCHSIVAEFSIMTNLATMANNMVDIGL